MRRFCLPSLLVGLLIAAAVSTPTSDAPRRGPRATLTNDAPCATAPTTSSGAESVSAAPTSAPTTNAASLAVDRWLSLDEACRELGLADCLHGLSDEALEAELTARFQAAADDDARDAILELLCTVSGSASIPFFANVALGTDRWSARIRHWGVIGLNHHATENAIDAMWRVAQTDPDPGIRFIAVEGLGSHVGARDRVLPILLSALESDDAVIRRGAVYGLDFLKDSRAVDALARLVEREPEATIAAEAVAFLGGYKGAENALHAIASSRLDASVVDAAWAALLSRGDARAEEEFLRRAAAGDVAALDRLASGGSARAEALLLQALDGPSGRDIAEAWSARAAEGDDQARAMLDRALASASNPSARTAAAAALVEAGVDDALAIDVLSRAAGEDDPVTRRTALVALFWGNRPEGIDACERAARAGDEVALDLLEAHALYGGDRAACEAALERLQASAEARERLDRVRSAQADPTVERWLAGVPVDAELTDRTSRGDAGDPILRVFFRFARRP